MTVRRIDPLAENRRSLFVRLVRWLARRRFGAVPMPFDAYEHSPPLLAAMGTYELAAERARALDPTLKLLAELKVAALVGCRFCLDIGSSLARAHGVSVAQVRELHDHATSGAFTPIEQLVLDYATVMSATPVVVPDALFFTLKERLGERAIVELTTAIGWENYRARVNHALGFGAQGFSDGSVCAIPQSHTEPPRALTV